MSSIINLTGKHFGKLTVIKRVNNIGKRVTWHCQCDCGKIRNVMSTNLICGKTSSCGCIRNAKTKETNTKHGLKNTRLYNIWVNMKQRCYNSNNPKYPIYGGRGIKICDDWKNYFFSFYNWAISNGYKENLTIDRMNVNGNYEPNNCRWITNQEQQKNRRNSKTEDIGK